MVQQKLEVQSLKESIEEDKIQIVTKTNIALKNLNKIMHEYIIDLNTSNEDLSKEIKNLRKQIMSLKNKSIDCYVK